MIELAIPIIIDDRNNVKNPSIVSWVRNWSASHKSAMFMIILKSPKDSIMKGKLTSLITGLRKVFIKARINPPKKRYLIFCGIIKPVKK